MCSGVGKRRSLACLALQVIHRIFHDYIAIYFVVSVCHAALFTIRLTWDLLIPCISASSRSVTFPRT